TARPHDAELSGETALRRAGRRASARRASLPRRPDPHLAALGGPSRAAAHTALRIRRARGDLAVRREPEPMDSRPQGLAVRATAQQQALRRVREGRVTIRAARVL